MAGHLNRAHSASKDPGVTTLGVWLLYVAALVAAFGLEGWTLSTQIPRTDIMEVCDVTPMDRAGIRNERYVVRTNQGEYSLRDVSFDGVALGKDQAAAQLRQGRVYEVDHAIPLFLLETPPGIRAITSLPEGAHSAGSGC